MAATTTAKSNPNGKPSLILTPLSKPIDYNEMRVYFAQITPEDAQAILDEEAGRNRQNRRIIQSNVRRLARAMQSGHWRLTHQGIAFDSAGILIDGQHRLLAVVESAQAQTFLVTEGLDKITRVATDIGTNRFLRDSLQIMGDTKHPRLVASIIGSVCRYGIGETARMDYDDAKAWMDRLRDGIEWASAAVGDDRSGRGLSSPAVVGAFAFAYRKAKKMIAKAWRDLEKGTGLAEDDPVWHLRERILTAPKMFRAQIGRRLLFMLTLNAIRLRMEGATTGLLKPSEATLRFFADSYAPQLN